MITSRASLDVPEATLEAVTRWLTTHRRRPGTRPVQRVATAYRYLHEAIDVIAQKAPMLPKVFEDAAAQDWPFLCSGSARSSPER